MILSQLCIGKRIKEGKLTFKFAIRLEANLVKTKTYFKASLIQ